MSQQGDKPNLNEDALGTDQKPTTSRKAEATSKEGKKVSITQAAYDKLKSDAEASAGRAKELTKAKSERDTLKGQNESLNTRLTNLEAQSRNTAREAARSSAEPSAMATFERTEALNQRERELDEGQTELKRGQLQLKADQEEVGRDKGVLTIPKIVAKYKLDEDAQAHLEGLGLTDEETLDKIAARLAGTKAIPESLAEAEEGAEGLTEVKSFEPLSTESTGAREQALTAETAESMPTRDLEQKLAPPPK